MKSAECATAEVSSRGSVSIDFVLTACATGLSTDSYQSRLVKALLDTFTCSINLAFHHVPVLRIVLPDYVWSYTEHKDLYCVFYCSAKQTSESVLIPGCTVSIFVCLLLRFTEYDDVLYTFTLSGQFQMS